MDKKVKTLFGGAERFGQSVWFLDPPILATVEQMEVEKVKNEI
jgi:hypothetical protein